MLCFVEFTKWWHRGRSLQSPTASYVTVACTFSMCHQIPLTYLLTYLGTYLYTLSVALSVQRVRGTERGRTRAAGTRSLLFVVRTDNKLLLYYFTFVLYYMIKIY